MNKEPTGASTVVLFSDRPAGGYEIFLMKRAEGHTYREGIYVFPGGLLEEADLNPELEACTGGFKGTRAKIILQEPDIPGSFALGLFMAAIRETFEEAGVLLARDSSGEVLDLSAPDAAPRFAVYRREIHQRRLSLVELARQEKLVFAPDLLVPYSHWITPETAPRRFNARFFLATLPAGQKPVHDNIELTGSCWMTPARALAEQSAGRMPMMPPTFKTITELSVFSATEELFAMVRLRKMKTIMPESFRTVDGFGIILPDDCSPAAGGQTEDEKKKTRIVMEAGAWKIVTR